MARTILHEKPGMQIVLQGEACQLGHHLDLNHIAYQKLDQPGPMAMRVDAADWQPIRAIAAGLGYVRPDFFGQSESIGRDPFKGFWLMQAAAARRLKKAAALEASRRA